MKSPVWSLRRGEAELILMSNPNNSSFIKEQKDATLTSCFEAVEEPSVPPSPENPEQYGLEIKGCYIRQF